MLLVAGPDPNRKEPDAQAETTIRGSRGRVYLEVRQVAERGFRIPSQVSVWNQFLKE